MLSNNKSPELPRRSTVPALTLTGEPKRIFKVWVDGKSPLTERYYRRDICILNHWLKRKGLSLLTPPLPQDLSDFFQWLSRKRRTIEQAKLVIRSFYSYCASAGFISSNPARFLKVIHSRNTLGQRIPTQDMVRTILKAAGRYGQTPTQRERNLLICEFALMTGARAAEISSTRCQDVRTTPLGVQVELFGKRRKTRTVLVDGEFGARLIGWVKRQSSHHEYLFVSTNSARPIGPGSILDLVKRIATCAGYPKFSPHWFRHAHATFALNAGCPIQVVQQTLGHASLMATERYLHAQPSQSSSKYVGVVKPSSNRVVPGSELIRIDNPNLRLVSAQPVGDLLIAVFRRVENESISTGQDDAGRPQSISQRR